ncbi:hypothetical protein DPMN_152259 [Dreissena polymorpha]|uniref:Uncharacterized protein n=1 Tax=Dreissena polymorpha TaxID=45954 RepID=A0A9D4FHX5_DREPO|nr:hypothetical protein DPMN_152228 [Dreissena polymorpha]KAH3798657.1 hypothetical protein DPMN_152259 [Dreissena polymorpha]
MGATSIEHQYLINILYERPGAYGMEVSIDKSKIMVNNITNSFTASSIWKQACYMMEPVPPRLVYACHWRPQRRPD